MKTLHLPNFDLQYSCGNRLICTFCLTLTYRRGAYVNEKAANYHLIKNDRPLNISCFSPILTFLVHAIVEIDTNWRPGCVIKVGDFSAVYLVSSVLQTTKQPKCKATTADKLLVVRAVIVINFESFAAKHHVKLLYSRVGSEKAGQIVENVRLQLVRTFSSASARPAN